MEILHYTAFASDPAGGNPAGVVLDARGLSDAEMQGIAADLGYSEAAFLFPTGESTADVRYFAPLVEVDFCGHATIASAVARAEREGPGELVLQAKVGPVPVRTALDEGLLLATLTTREPTVEPIAPSIVEELLAALRLTPADLDPDLPIRAAATNNLHPVVGVTRAALDALDYDYDALGALMYVHGWTTTVIVVCRLGPTEFFARNPFPPGGVREDPATGSAAATFGGYLRLQGLLEAPARVIIRQGDHIGRPGRLIVDVPASGGISVSGTAVPLS